MNSIKINVEPVRTIHEKEVYRTLRTNIEFTGVENRAITITSCTPNDGKTTVTYNLACAFADSDKKTLLVDADLRKSILFRRLQIQDSVKGLSHYLSGQENIRDVICSTNKDNLFMIPAGPFPSNPTELLGNERFAEILPVLKKAFDYILFDTPPLMNVIDAAVVAKKCDASLLVVASDCTSRTEVQNVAEQLRAANSNVLGVVLNKVDVRRGSYYGKKYGYGYKYGSYYGYNAKTSD